MLNKDSKVRIKEKIFEIKEKNVLWKFKVSIIFMKAFSKEEAWVWFEKIKNSIDEEK